MKLTTSIFVLTLAASTAMGQSVMAPINAAKRAANASSSRTAETNKALSAQQASAPSAKAAQSSAMPAKSPFASAPAKQAPTAKNLAKASEMATTSTPANPAPEMRVKKGRDPFVSIIRTDTTGGKNPCESGKKCLVPGEIVLRGIIKSSDTIIAVVENSHKKTYFLHENDPVFNGEVVKITSDSIVFRERMTDRAGRIATREVTKQLNTRPIA
jgi:Tfp pilus assembly protein PilP